MSSSVAAVSLFCQDARDEVGGTVSLVGIMPDNVSFPSTANALPKLVIYTRINLPVDLTVASVEFFLRRPDGEKVAQNPIHSDLIDESLRNARAQGSPVAGIVSRVEAAPFPMQVGRFIAVIRVDETEYVGGTINLSHVRLDEAT